MIAKNLITILLLLVGSPIIQANPPLKQTVIGIVVAHDDGLELADGFLSGDGHRSREKSLGAQAD